MHTPLPFLRPLVAAALLAVAGGSQATIVVYTSQADFLAAVTGAQTDTFDDLVAGDPYTGPLTRSAGSFSYNVSAGPSSDVLYGAGSASDAWLSTNIATDSITFDSFSPGTYGVGAFVFGSDIGGNFIRFTKIVVSATDGDGTVSQTLVRTTPSSFIGFVSDSPLESLTVTAVQGRFRDIWPTVDNLIVASPVPEPETYAMLFSGLAALGFIAARRRVS